MAGEPGIGSTRVCRGIPDDDGSVKWHLTAAVAGGIAEAFYGVPEQYRTRMYRYLSPTLEQMALNFQEWLKKRRANAV